MRKHYFYIYFITLSLAAIIAALFSLHAANESVIQCNEACARAEETFDDQCHVSMTQREIAIAQEYANHLAILLDLEAHRAHELDEHLSEIKDAYVKLFGQRQSEQAMVQMQMQMIHGYVNQLICYIEENKLPVPAPKPGQWDVPGIQIELEPVQQQPPKLDEPGEIMNFFEDLN